MGREVLGHIDCPACGTKDGMRITPDKNGEPFGYCEANCSAQLRIGGDRRRVAAFVARYPWAKPPAVPVTAPAPAPGPAPAAAKTSTPAKPKADPAPAPAPAAKRPATPFDILGQFSR